MQSKTTLKWLLIIASILAVSSPSIIFLIIGSSSQSEVVEQGSVLAATDIRSADASKQPDLFAAGTVKFINDIVAQAHTTANLPARLKIPKINIDAQLEYVGLDKSGAMAPPQNLTDAAWLKLGTPPGEIGDAVIAGHYGFKDGQGSVFDNLYKLRAGDKIFIEKNNGEIITFVVSGNRRFASNADASGVFVSADGRSHLNLITCEGSWNNAAKGYTKRLVVFSDKE